MRLQNRLPLSQRHMHCRDAIRRTHMAIPQSSSCSAIHIRRTHVQQLREDSAENKQPALAFTYSLKLLW
jgi:hypothetical protein